MRSGGSQSAVGLRAVAWGRERSGWGWASPRRLDVYIAPGGGSPSDNGHFLLHVDRILASHHRSGGEMGSRMIGLQSGDDLPGGPDRAMRIVCGRPPMAASMCGKGVRLGEGNISAHSRISSGGVSGRRRPQFAGLLHPSEAWGRHGDPAGSVTEVDISPGDGLRMGATAPGSRSPDPSLLECRWACRCWCSGIDMPCGRGDHAGPGAIRSCLGGCQ
jgi:hypothetical protein